jgi:hypothetical protein
MFVADIIHFLDAYRLSRLRAAVWMEILIFVFFSKGNWLYIPFLVCMIGLIVCVLIAFGY